MERALAVAVQVSLVLRIRADIFVRGPGGLAFWCAVEVDMTFCVDAILLVALAEGIVDPRQAEQAFEVTSDVGTYLRTGESWAYATWPEMAAAEVAEDPTREV